MGSRSNWGIVARSEAEFNEIVDNLNEQEVRALLQWMPNTYSLLFKAFKEWMLSMFWDKVTVESWFSN